MSRAEEVWQKAYERYIEPGGGEGTAIAIISAYGEERYREGKEAMLEDAHRLEDRCVAAEEERNRERRHRSLLIAEARLSLRLHRMAVARAQAEQQRREAAELIIKRMEEWAFVAFYPGPNENPHFQAGYMEAIGEAGAVLARLKREALSPQTPQEMSRGN